MKCSECGYESSEQFAHCPHCGAPSQDQSVSENTAAATVLAMLQDKLFLFLCIAVAASCILSISAGGLPLLHILIAVFLWLAYADAKKGTVNTEHLRSVSGTVYAQYVINHILAVLTLVMGVLFAALCYYATETVTVHQVLSEVLAEVLADFNLSIDLTMILALSGTVVLIVFALVAVLVEVFNILSLGKIHRFLKSLYTGVQAGKLELKSFSGARAWLLILGICSGLGILDMLIDPLAALSSAVSCTGCILAWILIGKHLTDKS